ncbi:MAG: hypothetical protein ACE5O2_08965, partial [Armatimonadota bacterium]
VLLCFAIGLYPKPFFDRTRASLVHMLHSTGHDLPPAEARALAQRAEGGSDGGGHAMAPGSRIERWQSSASGAEALSREGEAASAPGPSDDEGESGDVEKVMADG